MDPELYGPWPQVYGWSTGGLPNPPKPPNAFAERMRRALGLNPAGVAMGADAWNSAPAAELPYQSGPWSNMPAMERPVQGAPPPVPPPAPAVPGAPAAVPTQAPASPVNPYLERFLNPPARSPLPAPPTLSAPTLPEDPYRKLIMDQLAKGGGGVRTPQMPALPGPPPASTPIDWGPLNEAYEKARPKKYEADGKEMWLTGLLGALAGFGDARPGERLGITLGRMAGAGAQAGLGERKNQQALARQSEKEQSQFELLMAQNKQGQTLTDAQRKDLDANKVYEHGFKTWNANMQWLNLQNDIQSRNAGLGMQRLQLLASLAGQDRDTAIRLKALENDLATGNWERAMKVAQTEEARTQTDLSRSMGLFTLLTKDKQGRVGGLPIESQFGALLPQIESGKIRVPGLNMQEITAAAAAQMPKNSMTLPPAVQTQMFKDTVSNLIMQKVMSDPVLFQQIMRAGGGMPLSLFGGSSSSSSSTTANPYSGMMNE